MNFFKKMSKELGKQRTIDVSVEKTLKSMKSGYRIVPNMEIKAWKSYLVVTFAAGFAAALIWGSYMSIYQTSIASGTVTLAVSSDVASHKTGDQFPVQIILDTAGKNIVAVQAIFNFNKNAIQVVNIDISGSDFNYEIKNSIDAEAGQGFLALAKPTPGVNGTAVKIATINLKALADISEPTLQLKLSTFNAVSDSAAILDDGQGTNVLQEVRNLWQGDTSTDNNESNFSINSITGLADTIVRIDWTEGPHENRSYIIERRTAKTSFSRVAEVGSEEKTFIDRSTTRSTSYYYKICQLGDGGQETCTPEGQVKTQNKKKMFTPRLIGGLENGKVRISWSPNYSSDFKVIVQRKGGKSKKYSTISVNSSDSQNSYVDESVISGTKYTYRLTVKASKKKTKNSKTFKVIAP
jgi:hypothetical protein